RILQNIGLRPDESTAIEPYDAMYAWRNAKREDLMLVDWSGIGPTGWHTANFFAQPLFEPQLDQLAKNQPTVAYHRGWEVVAIEEPAEGTPDHADSAVTLVLEGSDGMQRNGERRELTATYVVGADGANSFIRNAMGSPMHDLGFFYDWLIVDLMLTEPRVFDPPAWQLCDPARPTTIVPGGPGRRRWEFLRLPHEDIKDLNRMERAWELLEPWDVHPGNATVERHTVYTFQAKWAETWRRGRLMIAGDAAHLMPPFAGQGMCAGLRDAMNLAWKLSLVLQGKADEAVLDSYGPERAPHVREFIDFSISLGKVICITDPEEAAARDAAMIAARLDPSVAPPEPAPSPRLGPGLLRTDDQAGGLMSIQAPVTSTNGTGLFDDVVGAGVLLLGSQSLHLDDSRAAALGDVGLTVVALGGQPSAGVVVDDTGAYRAWLDGFGADAVLIRPDFAIYGTAHGADDLTSLVDEYLTHLGHTPTSNRLSTSTAAG
ncbi:MAG: bifunctional 3-(3-hydroxy-phenyl)propionate/3-hydroxycinnamic acid hydroxylase, partial [Nakamurella sp.]